MVADLLQQLLGPVCAAVGVYAAIRADLARIGLMAQHAHAAAEKAHARIDGMKDAR